MLAKKPAALVGVALVCFFGLRAKQYCALRYWWNEFEFGDHPAPEFWFRGYPRGRRGLITSISNRLLRDRWRWSASHWLPGFVQGPGTDAFGTDLCGGSGSVHSGRGVFESQRGSICSFILLHRLGWTGHWIRNHDHFAEWADRAFPGSAALQCSSRIERDRKSTRLNSSHGYISYAVFCLKKKK